MIFIIDYFKESCIYQSMLLLWKVAVLKLFSHQTQGKSSTHYFPDSGTPEKPKAAEPRPEPDCCCILKKKNKKWDGSLWLGKNYTGKCKFTLMRMFSLWFCPRRRRNPRAKVMLKRRKTNTDRNVKANSVCSLSH